MEKKKLSLSELKVKSFITSIDTDKQLTVNGGHQMSIPAGRCLGENASAKAGLGNCVKSQQVHHIKACRDQELLEQMMETPADDPAENGEVMRQVARTTAYGVIGAVSLKFAVAGAIALLPVPTSRPAAGAAFALVP